MENVELRCASRMHGEMVRPGVLEVRCHSRFCGKRAGVVILHWFDLETGKLIDTKEYKTVQLQNGEEDDGTNITAVRHEGLQDHSVRGRGRDGAQRGGS